MTREDRVHRRRQRRLHEEPARRHPRLPGAARRRDRAARHRPRPARDRRGDGALRSRRDAARRRRSRRTTTAASALDGADFVINMVQIGGHDVDARRLRDPGAVRAPPDDRRHARHRRHLPRPPHGPAHARARPRDGRALPGRVAAQLHEPDGDALLARLRGTPTQKVVGLCHSVQYTTRDLAAIVGVPSEEVDVPRRRHQPPGVPPSLRARRRGSLPAARRAHRGDPDLQRRVRFAVYERLRVLPDRVERALSPSTCRGSCATTTELDRFRIPVDEYIRRSEENLDEFERVQRRARRAASRCRSARSSEYAPLIIHSIDTGEPSVIYGNVRNTRLIANLPDGRVRRGAVPGRRDRRPADARAGLPAAARRAQPHVS